MNNTHFNPPHQNGTALELAVSLGFKVEISVPGKKIGKFRNKDIHLFRENFQLYRFLFIYYFFIIFKRYLRNTHKTEAPQGVLL